MNRNPKNGFTLVELLVVLGIIVLLLGLLMPAIQSARENARRINCGNNARQLALAVHLHENSLGFVPPALGIAPKYLLLHWQARLLPYMEQAALYEQIMNERQVWLNPKNSQFYSQNVAVFQCASNPDMGLGVVSEIGYVFAFTDYCGVSGYSKNDGFFSLEARWRALEGKTYFQEVTSGLSNTLMFGERPPSDFEQGMGAWLGSQNQLASTALLNAPAEFLERFADNFTPCANRDFLGYQMGNRGDRCGWTHHWSFHPGGANFARVDGSIFLLPYSTDSQVLADLARKD